MLKLYNSFSKQKESFIPLTPKEVGLYVCGMTVYDFCHIGHARMVVVFDMIRSWFISSGYKVTFVQNITDIDDKIIKRAVENKETIYELTERYINYMYEDFDKLGVKRPDVQPKATDYIEQMLNMITNIIKKDYAYQADNGDIYYKVRKFGNYGKLSGKSLADLRAGERVAIDQNKQDPLDFVLWKTSKPGEPYWESPFGNGRPGWHIECSAMSENILGKHFDIHGGGQDLQFPHHENEIAQSEAHNNCKFVNYWMHNGFVNFNDEKMSKSLGNFFTIRDILEEFDGETIRFFILRSHYRSPLNFSHGALIDAKNSLTRIYQALKSYNLTKDSLINWSNPYATSFKQAMDDDFNTPLAISILFELITEINKNEDLELANLLVALANSIGLVTSNSNQFLQAGTKLSESEIGELIDKRAYARQTKNFSLSDEIRDILLNNGIILEDNKNGTIWRKL